MLQAQMDQMTSVYQSSMAAVSMIDRLDTSDEDFYPPDIRTRRELIDALFRNKNHIEIILGGYPWTEEFDLAPFHAAIAKANARLEILRNN